MRDWIIVTAIFAAAIALITLSAREWTAPQPYPPHDEYQEYLDQGYINRPAWADSVIASWVLENSV
jgi:hypothetical protein